MNDELIGKVHCLDFFELSRQVEDASVDLYLGDLPYGTVDCAWDSIIPFAPMWAELKRIIKPRGAIVLTSTQPFTTALIASNMSMFKYSWVWVKNSVSSPAIAHYQPLRVTEDICVFNSGVYYPQGVKPFNKLVNKGKKAGGDVYRGRLDTGKSYLQEFTDYPKNILYFERPASNSHPSEKPVALFEYLIRTYTRPNELVADFTVGSGTTAVASRNLNRRFIVGDFTPEYCEIARKRLAQPFTPQMFDETPDTREKPTQSSMFEEASHA